MNIVITRGRVLVEPEVTKSVGKITLPESSVQAPSRGRIVAFGKGRQLESGREADIGVSMAVGTTVLFSKGSGVEVEYDGRKCLILSHEDVIGIYPTKSDAPISVTNPAVQDPPKTSHIPKPEAGPEAARKAVA